jgi:hypothetical protein
MPTISLSEETLNSMSPVEQQMYAAILRNVAEQPETEDEVSQERTQPCQK